jgi:hypothetical protein
MPLKLPLLSDPGNPDHREIRRAFKDLDDPWRDRVEVSTTLRSGDNLVRHSLGRAPTRWLITDIDGAATVHRTGTPTSDTITLTASDTVTVTLIFW